MQKTIKIRTLIKQLFTKYQFSTKLPQISHIHKNHNFLSIIGTFKGTNGRQKTYEIFYVYCIFYSGFMCQTTVI